MSGKPLTPKAVRDAAVVPIGERFLKKSGEHESMSGHFEKIPGVTRRLSAR